MDIKTASKDVSYYLNLPWTYTVGQDSDSNSGKIYILSINELPHVMTDGSSIAEAFESIQEALALYVESCLCEGHAIAEPVNRYSFKSTIAYRTTSERHHRLTQEATKRNLSLSQTIDTFIDEALAGMDGSKL